MNLTNSMKKFGIEQTFKYVYKDPETNLRKLMDWGDSFANGSFPAQRALIRRIIEDENHPYHAYILHMFNDIDVSVMTKISENFFINANLVGWPIQQELREKYNCNIPWAILLDPTSACNLHCTGCWAAE